MMTDIAGLIDHTLLKADATKEQIQRLCEEAQTVSVCFSLCESNLGKIC